MEQFRLFIAIALSVLVFVVWNLFFVEKPQPPVKKPVVEKQTEKKSVVKKETEIKESEKQKLVKKKEPVIDRDEKFYIIDTPLYTAKLSDKGANFRSFKLKKYKETKKKEDLKELVKYDQNLTMSFKDKSIEGLETAFFSTDSTGKVEASNSKKEITFTYTSRNNIIVEKTYTFDPKTYVVGCRINVKNLSNSAFNDTIQLTLVNGNPESRLSFTGASIYKNGKVEQFKLDDLDDKNSAIGKIAWASFQDRYFLSSIIPVKSEQLSFHVSMNNNISKTTLESKLPVVNKDMQRSQDFGIYMGPIQTDALEAAGNNLSETLDFGWFTFLGKPCLMAMNFIHDYIPNYGLAIIILTLLIKIVLWPLGNKGYKSMNEMKKLQPIMTEIREKYKDDKKRMNEEVMNLYKTYKINPLGGCLPIVAQIPIFFAFYRMLYQAIELRHAPFFGWINDLSAPDRLFDLGVTIPFMEPPYGIPVLTILMGASMFIQQKMTPQAGDATQAKIMMLMPIFMTVIFVNFSSGLVLYWFVNNLFSIGQQYYTMKKKRK